jgi:hypothetical protein
MAKKQKPEDTLAATRDAFPPGDQPFGNPAPSVPATPRYGIADAIALMRGLPAEVQATDIVVQIIKRTLESARIDVAAIIVDATRKEDTLDRRIATLLDEIAKHEQEIRTRAAEISQLQTDGAETSRVKQRLLLAEKLTSGT